MGIAEGPGGRRDETAAGLRWEGVAANSTVSRERDVALPQDMDHGGRRVRLSRRRRDGDSHPLREGRWPGPLGDRVAASRRCCEADRDVPAQGRPS